MHLKVTDESENESLCRAIVDVKDFFDGYNLELDLPEFCIEPFQNTYDFSPYLSITSAEGLNYSHSSISAVGG